MGLIYFLYFGLSAFVIFKGFTLTFIQKALYRFPVSIKEKEVLKFYHGIDRLSVNMEAYRNVVFQNVMLMVPLVFIGLVVDSSLALLALTLMFGASRLRYIKMKNIVSQRRVEFFKEYPTFLNCLRLYLQAGLTLENALSTYFSYGGQGYYLALVKNGLEKIKLGSNRREAFMEVILCTRERELIKLVNFFIRFYLVGGDGNTYLMHLGEDAWKLKKETIKRLAEEGSAKMVLPMMLIFVGVGLLVLIPSVFSIMQGNIF